MSPRLRGVLPLVPAVVVLLIALLGPELHSSSPTSPVGRSFEGPGPVALLGTDALGRDLLSRTLDGGRTIVVQALAATLLGSLIGIPVGLWTGATRFRFAADLIGRGIDAVSAVPALLLLLLLAAGFPGEDLAVTIAIAAVSFPFSVRVLREGTAALAASEYAREAAARGDRPIEIARYDLLPGIVPIALAEAGIRFVAATQLAATAGFLGLGTGAPAPNWGRMVRENAMGLEQAPLPVLVPALLLVVLAISITFLLDRLAEARFGGLRALEVTA